MIDTVPKFIQQYAAHACDLKVKFTDLKVLY